MTVVVVGGGITGMAAAWELRRADAALDVVLLEADARLGGKLRTSPFVDHAVDEGADAFLARTTSAIDLCRELGLADRLVAPATGAASVWVDGALRRLPDGHVLGVPTDLDAAGASGVLTPAGVERARADLTRSRDDVPPDETVGSLVRRRLGDEVLDRLVGPLVGGINAGDADRLSVRAVTPQLASAADAGPSLIAALRAQRAAAPATGPVFLTLPDGLGTVAGRLAEELSRTVDVRPATAVEGIGRGGARWSVRTATGCLPADAVVVTAPATVAARLVHDLSPAAAAALAAIDYASVAIVTVALRVDDLAGPLDGSGFLVPRGGDLALTACSWLSAKWPHLARDGTSVLRLAVGRHGDPGALDLDDEALVARLHADLGVTMGITAPFVAARVSRWPGSFPQYAPGHLAAVDEIDAALARDAPGVVAAGAALRGLGVPACIEQGRRATHRALLVYK